MVDRQEALSGPGPQASTLAGMERALRAASCLAAWCPPGAGVKYADTRSEHADLRGRFTGRGGAAVTGRGGRRCHGAGGSVKRAKH